MREISIDEQETVSGGVWQFLVGWAGGHLLDWTIEQHIEQAEANAIRQIEAGAGTYG